MDYEGLTPDDLANVRALNAAWLDLTQGVTGLLLALTLVGYRVARRAPDLFGQLLALGCANFLALQAFLHIGVGVGLIPGAGGRVNHKKVEILPLDLSDKLFDGRKF